PDRRAATAAESINARLVKAYLSWFKTGSSRAETGWDPSSPQRRYLRRARREPFTLTGFCSAALGQLRAYGALGFSRRKTASTSRPAEKKSGAGGPAPDWVSLRQDDFRKPWPCLQ